MEDNKAVETVWVEASYGDAPPGTLVGGQDSKGEPINVARATCMEDLTPGKLIASHGCMYFSCTGKEFKMYQYEVLVGSTNVWVPASGHKIPTKSYAGGYTRGGEPLYIGRVRHQGTITPGKVQQSHGLCYIAFEGQELFLRLRSPYLLVTTENCAVKLTRICKLCSLFYRIYTNNYRFIFTDFTHLITTIF